jgi:putative DNA methylase
VSTEEQADGMDDDSMPIDTMADMSSRLVDIWFPCPEVDAAVRTPAGSGRSEKALFTWFASRPIAQARAAVYCSLLPDTEDNRRDIRAAVSAGDQGAMDRLRSAIREQFGDKPPVVLDMFSGRGIIPLEASRAGLSAVGTDLSPVATLGGRLLGDFPLRDWSSEPPLPFDVVQEPGAGDDDDGHDEPPALFEGEGPRLLLDVQRVLAEVGRRVAERVADLYPGNPLRGGAVPWAYLWAVTVPCDGCKRRFPLVGAMRLRFPNPRQSDPGQSFLIVTDEDEWSVRVVDGEPTQEPTFFSPRGRRGRSARCPFPDCGHIHTLDVVKAKGFAGLYQDAMLVVGETDTDAQRKVFRVPRNDEVSAASAADPRGLPPIGGRSAVPDEEIPEENTGPVRGRAYGYKTYGSLMNDRQAVLFATTARVISELFEELKQTVSEQYATALAGYAAANLPRQIRRSTRGANLAPFGGNASRQSTWVQIGDVFSSQSVIKHQFDYAEAGPSGGPGTWSSVSSTLLQALRKILEESDRSARPGRYQRASAVKLPFRDNSIDAVVTDPPYYDMITYADTSDLFHVWFKRALGSAMPDLFGGPADDGDGLQDKSEEIIVAASQTEGEHRTREFYEQMLAKSFLEAKRVLKPGGHLTVIFGHADPEAWKRLLNALSDAGFVITSSWPSRTETAVTGVATISVTVTIGCRVAPDSRPVGIAAQVDADVLADVRRRCRQWDQDGLALEDQMMASYGAALSIVGRFDKVITPAGEEVPLEHYMTLARRAVREAVALRLDEQPLETFDPFTRFAVFWHELYGRADVPKGEARFFAQSDELRIEDLRGPILKESSKGFRLRHDPPDRITPSSSMYEVVRAMAGAQSSGTDAVAAVIAAAQIPAADAHLWAVVDWVASKLPSSDPVAVALASVKRSTAPIQAAVPGATSRMSPDSQMSLYEEAT